MTTFVASYVDCAADADHDVGEGCTYKIAWALNPHMVIGSTNCARARRQHARLLRTVRELGAYVAQVPFVHGAFDSVFAKDNAIYYQDRLGLHAALARPRHHQRQMEQGPRSTALRALGAEVVEVAAEFEGGDVVIDPAQRVAYLGHGFRSNREAAATLALTLGMPVVPLELVDPVLYHLDTALVVLDNGTALFCEEAFAPASLELLHAAFELCIAVPRAVASSFALNFVEVGKTIVSGSSSPLTTAVLRALGKEVIVVELDEFQRAGGSAACLLGRVHDWNAATARRSIAA